MNYILGPRQINVLLGISPRVLNSQPSYYVQFQLNLCLKRCLISFAQVLKIE